MARGMIVLCHQCILHTTVNVFCAALDTSTFNVLTHSLCVNCHHFITFNHKIILGWQDPGLGTSKRLKGFTMGSQGARCQPQVLASDDLSNVLHFELTCAIYAPPCYFYYGVRHLTGVC